MKTRIFQARFMAVSMPGGYPYSFSRLWIPTKLITWLGGTTGAIALLEIPGYPTSKAVLFGALDGLRDDVRETLQAVHQRLASLVPRRRMESRTPRYIP